MGRPPTDPRCHPAWHDRENIQLGARGPEAESGVEFLSSPEVDTWFATNRPPAEAVLQRARQVILGADSRMSEYIKYGSVVLGYGGDFASFVQAKEKTVSIMFNRGAHIKGDFPNLEGTGPTARFMRFATVGEVEKHAAELARIAVAWCDQVDTPGASPGRR